LVTDGYVSSHNNEGGNADDKCRGGEPTNWCDENDDVDKEPIRDHGNGSTHVAHALRVDLGRITEWDGQEG
jgi:hypothetical protein